jgi:hypothetical protein
MAAEAGQLRKRLSYASVTLGKGRQSKPLRSPTDAAPHGRLPLHCAGCRCGPWRGLPTHPTLMWSPVHTAARSPQGLLQKRVEQICQAHAPERAPGCQRFIPQPARRGRGAGGRRVRVCIKSRQSGTPETS